MAEKIKTKQNKNLKNKFRFVVLNDVTFEEKFSLSLTRTNVWIFLSVIAFTLVFLTAAAIIYTPLKYFIPGFGDYNYRSQILQLQFKTDSLQTALDSRELWLENIVNVANGTVDSTRPTAKTGTLTEKGQINLNEVSQEDQELRKEVEDAENYSLSYNANENSGMVDEVKQMHLMDPVEGYLTEEYDAAKGHFGIDIAAKQDAPVKAVLDGKIIADGYTLETGYVLTIQHPNNLISIYKHNSRLLKKTGTSVKAGEVIAVVGNTGELSTGPHLHFELWSNGKSLNPRNYIVF
ncbi:MAG: M23 family metallopeptidase [Chitinophagales bacterium]|nr:M23 family metallopeptidase [Chitinophagales bacterium]